VAKRSKALQRLEVDLKVFLKVPRLEAKFRTSFEVFEAERLAVFNCSIRLRGSGKEADSSQRNWEAVLSESTMNGSVTSVCCK
jgi:hypothetical protein